MEAKLIPVAGCMQVFLGICTLGIAPLAIYMKEREFPKTLDEGGLTTRGGKHFAWNDFTGIKKVLTRLSSGGYTERYELMGSKGKVPVVAYRFENGDNILQYIWEHLPESALQAG